MEGLPTSLDYDERWQRALGSPEVGKSAKFLIELELDFAMDTSCAERWFSLMNLIKSKRRSRMNIQLLDDLMMICTHAPKSITQLKSVLLDILVLWEEESKRGRYQGRWLKECQPIIEDLQHEEDICNEMEVRGYNLDQVDSFDEFVVQIE